MTLILIIAAYFLGSIPFSYLIARRCGIDIRQVGTRSASPGNVWRCVGHIAGALSLAAEVAKGAAPMLVARALTGDDLVVLLVGLAAMAGHNWPLFLGLNGGRGASLGLITILLVSTQWLGLALVPLAIVYFAMRDSAPAILVSFLLAPALAAIVGFNQMEIAAACGIPAITPLRRVTAPGESNNHGNRRQVFLNRLIFDRCERRRRESPPRLHRNPDAAGGQSGIL